MFFKATSTLQFESPIYLLNLSYAPLTCGKTPRARVTYIYKVQEKSVTLKKLELLEKLKDESYDLVVSCARASAQRSPSIAAETMPPA